MSAILALAILLVPQEDDSKRAREAVLGLPGFHAPPPQAPPPAPDPGPPASFMAPRVKRTPDDYKSLLEHNVFSPPKKKEAPRPDKKDDGPKPPEGPKMRTWTLTGIMRNAKDNRYEGLIEDAAARESKFLKAGDTIAGVTISEVTFDQVSYKKGDTAGVLKLKDTLSEQVAAGAGGSAAPSKPEDASEIEKTRERMKKRNRRESVPDEAEEDAQTQKKPKS